MKTCNRIFFIRILMLLPLFVVALASGTSFADEPVKIGVLAFRPKPQTLAQWQPLAAALKQAIPSRDFVIEALTYPELDAAIASRQLDFVLTNPGHYVLLTKRIGLTAPFATLATNENGLTSTAFGGVIFCRADNMKVSKLGDIKGKTIATTSPDSLGGYQTQAYELSKTGIRLPQDARLIPTGMPHDNVVQMVLSGRADVGFVRTGVLEDMAHEGHLDMSLVKVINSQNLSSYPVLLSTKLYPEWPFAALPHIDEKLARHVAAAVFMLEENSVVMRKIGIHGFVNPADYTPVADLLKELRLPPFDVAPAFTLSDVWVRYFWQLIVALLAIGLILLLGIRLLFARRKLKFQHRAASEANEKMSSLLNSMKEGAYGVDTRGNCTFVNHSFLSLLGYASPEEVIGKHMHELIHHSYPDGSHYPTAACKMHEIFTKPHEDPHYVDEVFWRKDGTALPVEYWVQPMMIEGVITGAVTTFFDITQRKKADEQIRQLAYFDALTNLPNRRLLNDRLTQAMAASKRGNYFGAVMFLDLDNFKPINDKHGHAVGDLLLVETAMRLKSCVREVDTVARFGGDEFVVMLGELDMDKTAAILQARLVAEKILSALSAPYFLNISRDGQPNSAVEHHCTASIGVAMFINNEAIKDDILKWADAAMYQAKDAGRNSIRFYESVGGED